MMKHILLCAAAAGLLAGGGDAQVINKGQIDTNRILNPAATQPHVKM